MFTLFVCFTQIHNSECEIKIGNSVICDMNFNILQSMCFEVRTPELE